MVEIVELIEYGHNIIVIQLWQVRYERASEYWNQYELKDGHFLLVRYSKTIRRASKWLNIL